MYNREKRRFAKLVIDKYRELGRTTGPSRYAKEYRRLRDYAEAIFLALGQKKATLVTRHDIVQALKIIDAPYEHRGQLEYTANLAIAGIEGLPPEPFSNDYQCYCGGTYSLGHDDSYYCDRCRYRGRSDQHGFPVSFPAVLGVRKQRSDFHELVKVIGRHWVSEEEVYQLIAFELRQPLPLVHAGLCTNELQLKLMLNAAQKVNDHLLERAS